MTLRKTGDRTCLSDITHEQSSDLYNLGSHEEMIEAELPPPQAGVRVERGILDQIMKISHITEKCKEDNHPLICFIDNSTVLDKIQHDYLWRVLANMEIKKHLLKLIMSLYCQQQTIV